MIDLTATAAWVQAVGSVVAIAVAIWLGERQHKRTREMWEHERSRLEDDRKERTYGAATIVAAALLEARDKAQQRKTLLSDIATTQQGQPITDDDLRFLRSFFAAAISSWNLLGDGVSRAIADLDRTSLFKVIDSKRAVEAYMGGLTSMLHLLESGQFSSSTVDTAIKSAMGRTDTIVERCQTAMDCIRDTYGIGFAPADQADAVAANSGEGG